MDPEWSYGVTEVWRGSDKATAKVLRKDHERTDPRRPKADLPVLRSVVTLAVAVGAEEAITGVNLEEAGPFMTAMPFSDLASHHPNCRTGASHVRWSTDEVGVDVGIVDGGVDLTLTAHLADGEPRRLHFSRTSLSRDKVQAFVASCGSVARQRASPVTK